MKDIPHGGNFRDPSGAEAHSTRSRGKRDQWSARTDKDGVYVRTVIWTSNVRSLNR
jgi:hypothetical protein